MISVVLKPADGGGAVTFTVFLPPVVMGSPNAQPFSTVCIKARQLAGAAAIGAQIVYETEPMAGTANCVVLPL